MADPADHQSVEDYILSLHSGDPFAAVREASDVHREAHGAYCGVYPSGPHKMRLLATITRAAGAQRILEIGCGLGYSALWLADAAGPNGRLDAIDRFSEHTVLARQYAAEFGFAERISLLEGEGDSVLQSLAGPYDLIHDDGWFAREPAYFDSMVELLRPGGLLAISNWFLLEDAITGEATMDWSQFAGPQWAEHVRDYARKLTSDSRLDVSFATRPWLALVVKI